MTKAIISDYLQAEMEKARIASLPPALQKACGDPWHYSVGLITGEKFAFVHAVYEGGDYIHLEGHEEDGSGCTRIIETEKLLPHEDDDITYTRGIDIRLKAIAWVRDGGD